MQPIFQTTKNHKKHFTATGYTVNKDRTKMLLIHHKGLGKWLPDGQGAVSNSRLYE